MPTKRTKRVVQKKATTPSVKGAEDARTSLGYGTFTPGTLGNEGIRALKQYVEFPPVPEFGGKYSPNTTISPTYAWGDRKWAKFHGDVKPERADGNFATELFAKPVPGSGKVYLVRVCLHSGKNSSGPTVWEGRFAGPPSCLRIRNYVKRSVLEHLEKRKAC